MTAVTEPAVTEPLTLPCGVTVKNRLLKGAMSEALGRRDHAPRPELPALYRRWAEGGTGILLTGNVMVDARALGEPGNVVLEDERHLAEFHAWAVQGSRNGAALWMQLNHPGKQAPRGLNAGGTVAPSAVPYPGGMARAFETPRALTVSEIHDLTARFARSARLAQRAGFGGVQLHAAHGYLMSQFLSPRHNVRRDEYGGSLENRMRFVLETFRAVRAAVGPHFPVSVKLNSSDFVRGGFSEEDSLAVVAALGEQGCDLIEISGGTYEKPMMMLGSRERGGFFADFAGRARAAAGVPLCVTGGFRDAATIRQALASGAADVVGLARPLVTDPQFSARVLRGEDVSSEVRPLRTGVALLDGTGYLEIAWYEDAMRRLARGEQVRASEAPLLALARIAAETGLGAVLKRRRA
ncbi:NADH:flavin oxidoreductase/NADH oxidase family protein [Deinococcus sp. SL84]|uniref:NADH:flavin oxidoreductase/NADH oxidase family protein n=1 Tax=Deinococcus sp. SL84 TaxID=2994663 RepID=UPI002272C34A|nr:NADH:flavin oxidoreductase/NADH oxidase family protein [Deinococcus sp. SL84]MCY1702819.1 NADH:flavin oxidoreductase/NADH oxidase family protein [Deinococcus sp. SL84]